MAKLEIANRARKFLFGLPGKQFKQAVSAILNLLDDPLPHDSAALKGSRRGERRLDIGEYRVIYVISGDTVEVLAVGKRNDDEIYKKWGRVS